MRFMNKDKMNYNMKIKIFKEIDGDIQKNNR